ncbi:arginyl-tRNA--protein transferase 1 isoform X2 [Bradysia coprophila]|uniref:arginyl-tRNA--protein transferase 1 isoform X2 n=1 Tax=Bradysia coprophila TaxID=38358 RepID=UPI00187DBB25|nr:arginyl-tRNA--protein transferase 1 isoform X2 [Bradysia coprophila]
MAESTRQFSIVEYYGEQRKNRCGYCKQSDSCYSHGMQAHCLTNQDYQDLIDRGWRRSGTYCYKPKNDETCCPCYTIKCDISSFSLSKSQKKIIKKFNKFLIDGHRDKSDETVTSPNQTEQHAPMDYNSSFVEPNRSEIEFDVDKAKDIVLQTMKEKGAQGCNSEMVQKNAVVVPSCSENYISGSKSNENGNATTKDTSRKSSVSGPDASKPLKKKAKLMRMERKAQKLASTNQLPDHVPKKEAKNVQKTLAMLLNEVPENCRHKLEVKLLAVAGNQRKLSAEELSLYKRYQTVIHNDDEPSASEFEDFLISSPLEPEQSSICTTVVFGSYHQQYWLDGKLIAVGVIDILPSCVSSVYFFYDPDYSFLSLGTYGSLREIHLTQQLQQQVSAINSYYMGFYIHSCPKMRYKGKLTGSYLLCPEAYTWHLLNDDVIERLNAHKYQRLNDDRSVQDVNRFSAANLGGIMVLCKARVLMTFSQFAEKYPRSADSEEFSEYGRLVGRSIAARIVMLIF